MGNDPLPDERVKRKVLDAHRALQDLIEELALAGGTEFSDALSQEPLDIQAYLPKILPPSWEFMKLFVQGITPMAAFQCDSGLVVTITVRRYKDGRLWKHVSLSHRDALPSWKELRSVKDIFVGREGHAFQVFPPESEWVNVNPNCLHLYQCLSGYPLPDFRVAGGL